MAPTSIPQPDWRAAGRKAWATRQARRAIPGFQERLDQLIARRDCYQMLIADSGVTAETHRRMDQAIDAGLRLDAVCDLIFENAPRATALSRCDGSPADILDILDTDAHHRGKLRQVRSQIRALLQAHL